MIKVISDGGSMQCTNVKQILFRLLFFFFFFSVNI